MDSHHSTEKVSYEITTSNGKPPICNVTVQSPRVAEIDAHGDDLIDELEALAWDIDLAKVRRARAELMARANRNPLFGWASTHYVGIS